MKIYAHRGFSAKFPEATHAAYQGAIDAGADGLECDIRLSREGTPICFHDRTTWRISKKFRFVSRLSVLELKKLVSAIELRELISLAVSNKRNLLIETKHPTFAGKKVESAVLAEVAKVSGIRVTLMSFSLLAIRRFARAHKDVAYVIGRRWRLLYIPTKTVAVNVELFEKSKWVRSRLAEKEVFLWTVNEIRFIDKLVQWQVAAVITDKPDLPFALR